MTKRNRKGYISIEAILVTGVLMVLAVNSITAYRKKSGGLVDTAIVEMNRVDNPYNPGEN